MSEPTPPLYLSLENDLNEKELQYLSNKEPEGLDDLETLLVEDGRPLIIRDMDRWECRHYPPEKDGEDEEDGEDGEDGEECFSETMDKLGYNILGTKSEVSLSCIALHKGLKDDELIKRIQYFLDNDINVVCDGKEGPNKAVVTSFKEGANNGKFGWIVYAEQTWSSVWKDWGPKSRQLIGVLLVCSSQSIHSLVDSSWNRSPPSLQVNTLATHKEFVRRGIASDMWRELMNTIKDEPFFKEQDWAIKRRDSGNPILELLIQGGVCLHNETSRQFYINRGFSFSSKNTQDALRARRDYTLKDISDQAKKQSEGAGPSVPLVAGR
jgi:ribosomal protein S18 acetylase RimI-like enzyme